MDGSLEGVSRGEEQLDFDKMGWLSTNCEVSAATDTVAGSPPEGEAFLGIRSSLLHVRLPVLLEPLPPLSCADVANALRGMRISPAMATMSAPRLGDKECCAVVPRFLFFFLRGDPRLCTTGVGVVDDEAAETTATEEVEGEVEDVSVK